MIWTILGIHGKGVGEGGNEGFGFEALSWIPAAKVWRTNDAAVGGSPATSVYDDAASSVFLPVSFSSSNTPMNPESAPVRKAPATVATMAAGTLR